MPFDTASSWGDSYGIAAKASPDWNPGGKSSGSAFDAYKDWNPGGSTMDRYWDKAGGPSFEQSYTTNWNANPSGFLNNYKDKYQSALAGQSGQGSGSGGGSFGSSGSAGSGFNQLLPGFSMYDPNAGKQAFTVAGVQGGEASPIAKLGLSLAGSVLGPVAGAAGGALAKGLFG
jgi:hypothetical protein